MFGGRVFWGEAVLMMELPRRHSGLDPLVGGRVHLNRELLRLHVPQELGGGLRVGLGQDHDHHV